MLRTLSSPAWRGRGHQALLRGQLGPDVPEELPEFVFMSYSEDWGTACKWDYTIKAALNSSCTGSAPKHVPSPGRGDEEGRIGQRLGHAQVMGLGGQHLCPFTPPSPPPTLAPRILALGCQGTSVPTATCHRHNSLSREKLQFGTSNLTHQETG